MLKHNAAQRYSLKDVIDHPWMKRNLGSNEEVKEELNRRRADPRFLENVE
jgi:hypothetical protein